MKFAYLILAHNNFDQLKLLIKAIDYPGNDIFIHLDKKLGTVDLEQFDNLTKCSSLFFIEDRVDVAWGRISIVEATLNLLESAINGGYDYYHMLSGIDFPIKTNSYIHHFFQENYGKEFVEIHSRFNEKTFKNRVGRYHLINGNKLRNSLFWRKINSLLIFLQRVLNIYHYRSVEKFRGGSAWFSITNSLSIELVKNKDKIINDFNYTLLPDEAFLQTYIQNSKYKDNLYKRDDGNSDCMRKIDWSRGNPYVYKINDYEELMASPQIFARKIDYKLSEKIFEKLSNG